MLAGEPPFTGAAAQAIIAKRFIAPIPPSADTRDVPAAVDTAVTRALARTPADRFPSAAEFAAALLATAADRERRAAHGERRRTATDARAIAVLPFANLSADPENEYFADGMTEEIINALAKVPGMQVASRTCSFAFKGKEVDVRQIGEQLGVATVLEGSVRKVGNRIRITAQLISVENGYHLWTERYDRQLEDVFAVQDEISRAIVDALKLRLAGDAAQVVRGHQGPRGVHPVSQGPLLLCQAVRARAPEGARPLRARVVPGPGLARAYAGIADVWCNLADDWVAPDDAYPRAKAAAERALQRDPELAEAITSSARCCAGTNGISRARRCSLRAP